MKESSVAAIIALAASTAGIAGASDAAVTQRVANGGFESADAQWTLQGAVI